MKFPKYLNFEWKIGSEMGPDVDLSITPDPWTKMVFGQYQFDI